jgi:hypothetical protein
MGRKDAYACGFAWVDVYVDRTNSKQAKELIAAANAGSESALPKIIKTGFAAIQLIYFFTAGEDEVKCWTLRRGMKAPQAAGTIHTDFEKGFICAEVMAFEELREAGSESAVKAKGRYRQEGKGYLMVDGDVVLFKFGRERPCRLLYACPAAALRAMLTLAPRCRHLRGDGGSRGLGCTQRSAACRGAWRVRVGRRLVGALRAQSTRPCSITRALRLGCVSASLHQAAMRFASASPSAALAAGATGSLPR